MNYDIDSGKILYGLGLLFAAAAFVYFVRDVVFGLSVTVKAALLFVSFVGFFVGGVGIERDVLDVVAFALSALSYVVFLGYVVARYDPSETGTFLLLAASAALFVGLGYVLRERSLSIQRRTAVAIVAGLVLVSVLLIGADVLGGGVTYTTELSETVSVTPSQGGPTDHDVLMTETRVGTVTAANGFVFTRPLDLPDLRGCVVGTDRVPDRGVSVRYETGSFDRPDVIAGTTERSFEVRAAIPMVANETGATTFAVERGTDCDVSRTEPTIVVVVGDEGFLPD